MGGFTHKFPNCPIYKSKRIVEKTIKCCVLLKFEGKDVGAVVSSFAFVMDIKNIMF